MWNDVGVITLESGILESSMIRNQKQAFRSREVCTIIYAVLAVLPALLLMTWLYTRDKLHPEPKRAVYRLFLLGAGIVLPAGLLERSLLNSTWMSDNRWTTNLAIAFFVAGMVEEFLKAAIVERGALQKGLMKTPIDCIVYSGAVALGFAMVENILYVTSSGFSTALLRSVTAVPAHFMFGIIMGSAFANAVVRNKNRAWAYILPAGAHGLYDTFALSNGWFMDVLLVVYLILLLEWVLRRIDKAIKVTDMYVVSTR